MTTSLERLILATSDLPWASYHNELSKHKQITPEFIVEHPELRLRLYENPNVTAEHYKKYQMRDHIKLMTNDINEILDNPNLPWCWSALSMTLSVSVIFDNPDLPWNYFAMSKNLSLSIHDVLQNLNLPWDKSSVSKLATDQIIDNYSDYPWDEFYMRIESIEFIRNHKIDWTWASKNMPISDILDNKDLPWKYNVISKRNDLSIQDIRLLKDKWEQHKYVFQDEFVNPWYNLTIETNITDILANPALPWLYYEISKNKTLTLDIINNNPHIQWNYRDLSQAPFITVSFVKQYLDQDWDWLELSINSALTLSDYDNHQDLPWNLIGLIQNKNTTFDDFINRPEFYRYLLPYCLNKH